MTDVDVYVDLLFLINAGMDALCLGLTGQLLHRRLKPWRVLFGATVGGVYAVIALFIETGQAAALVVDLAVCLLMCAIVFVGSSSGGWRCIARATGVYLVLSMLLGGVMTALYHLLNQAGLWSYLPTDEDGLGSWLFLLLATVGGVISLRGGRFLRRAAMVRDCLVTVEVDGRTVELHALVDSGNLLHDPIGGRAVICASLSALKPLLSPALWTVMRAGAEQLSRLSGTDEARRLRLIPTGTATGTALLVGVLPDRVTVTVTHRRRTTTREVTAMIAASDELTMVEALVPTELLE